MTNWRKSLLVVRHNTRRMKRTVLLENPLGYFPLPCSVRVRVRSKVSRVRVGSVGLGLVGLILGLGLELGFGLWFGLRECARGNVQGEMFVTPKDMHTLCITLYGKGEMKVMKMY